MTGCHRLSLLIAKLACSYLPMTQLWHLFHLLYRALSHICGGYEQTLLLPIWVRTPRGVLYLLTFVLMYFISPKGTWGCSPRVSGICLQERDNLLMPHLCPKIRKVALPTWWWLWLCRYLQALLVQGCPRPSPQSTWACILCFSYCSLAPITALSLREPCDQTDNYWK